MKLLAKTLCLLLAATTLALTGCSKKPKRPDPSTTAMGPSGGGLGGDSGNLAGDLAGTGLESRPDGWREVGDMVYGAVEPVYFDFDKSGIKESERAKLQAAKKFLEDHPEYRGIIFEGHCDWRGTAEYNLGLGDRRANACKKYVTTLGLAADKTEIVSKGDLEAKENGTDAEMAKERRVEIVFLKK